MKDWFGGHKREVVQGRLNVVEFDGTCVHGGRWGLWIWCFVSPGAGHLRDDGLGVSFVGIAFPGGVHGFGHGVRCDGGGLGAVLGAKAGVGSLGLNNPIKAWGIIKLRCGDFMTGGGARGRG